MASGSRATGPNFLSELERRFVQSSLDRMVERQPFEARQKRASPLLRYWYDKMGLAGAALPTGAELTVRAGKVFSFIDDPEHAIGVIDGLLRCVQSNPKSIKFDQSECEVVDLCADSVVKVLALEAKKTQRLRFLGDWPKNDDAREIVAATGLPKALGVALPDFPNFLTLPLIHGRKKGSLLSSSDKEFGVHKLISRLDQWFGEFDFQLTNAGKRRFGKLIGEVLANAEDHSGREQWWLCGYLRKPRTQQYGDCHITIFSFGRSLAESLQELPADSYLRRQIEELVDRHSRTGLFAPSQWTEADLWTLYALQDGVSRYHHEDSSRGVGTADMIEEFQQLGKTENHGASPKMCVLSGSTHVLFDGSYFMQDVDTDNGEHRRVIAFNESNDLRLRPDPKAVQSLKASFPGTLISLRFFLDPEYLVKRTQKK
jgi:hypothetical protein